MNHRNQKCRYRHQCGGVDKALNFDRHHLQKQTETEMFVAIHRDGSAYHGKPKKRERDNLINPNDGDRKDVARDDANEQHDNDDNKQ